MRDWLTARAAATPNREALVTGGTRLTFGELNRQVAQLCATWHGAGLQKGQHVAMVMHSSPATIVNLFAAIRLGLVLVPLAIRLTPSERRTLLFSANCRWLLPETAHEPLLLLRDDKGFDPLPLVPESNEARVAGFGDARLTPSAPMAIVRTSGTTGKAKGAVLTVSNFFHSALGATLRLGHMPQDRWLCVMPLWHVGGLALVTRAILLGATVILHPGFDPERFMHALHHEAVTIVSLVPTMLHRLLEYRDGDWPGKLRLILLGGAPLSSELQRRSSDSDLPVAPTWGLTEACSQVATRLPFEARCKPGSTGKPLLFTSIRIVDEAGNDKAPGEIGEIVVCGPTVMRGYWQDPRSTSVALIDGELRTSDLGYLDEEGDLFVLQRRNDLIISGGENVYSTEIENVLINHDQVEDAVVLGLDDEEWGQRVGAVVQLKDPTRIAIDDFSRFLRRRLATYKVPREWRFVDKIERSDSGKVKRSELARLFEDSSCHIARSTD
ncbi:MAG: o-succinylbenzoate--CoA ligase [Anaerolineae bacterium]|nr:o-succinylbenzoate--CoA ligase [Anaerolineae bacterium]